MSELLKLERVLPVTWGETSNVLPVVRVVTTQKTRPFEAARLSSPAALLASESVELTVSCQPRDFPEMLSGTWADHVPYVKVRFDPFTVEAMIKAVQPELSEVGTLQLTLLLLRVPVAAMEIGDEWEKDNKHSYSHNGLQVVTVKPKTRLHDAIQR